MSKAKARLIAKTEATTGEDWIDDRIDGAETHTHESIGDNKDVRRWIEPEFHPRMLKKLMRASYIHRRAVQVKSCLITLGMSPVNASNDFTNWLLAQKLLKTIRSVAYDREQFGYGGIEIIKNVGGKLVGFKRLDPKHLRCAKDGSGIYRIDHTAKNDTAETQGILGFWKHFGDERTFNRLGAEGKTSAADEAREIVWIPKFEDSESPYSEPDIITTLDSIYLNASASQRNIAFFENGALPHGIVSVTGADTDEEFDGVVRDFFQQNHQGARKHYRFMVISAPDEKAKIEIKTLDDGGKEGEFLELKRVTREEQIVAEGVPPRLLGISEAGSLGGGNESYGQMDIFNQTYVGPTQRTFEEHINAVFEYFNVAGRIRLDDWDYTDASQVIALKQSGIITTNEARKRLKLQPLEGETYDQILSEVLALKSKLSKLLNADITVAKDMRS